MLSWPAYTLCLAFAHFHSDISVSTKEKLASFFFPTFPSQQKHTVWEWLSELQLLGEIHTIWKNSGSGWLVKFWSKSQCLNLFLSGPWGKQVEIKSWFWLRAHPHSLPALDFLMVDFCWPNFYSLLFSIERTKSPSCSWKIRHYFTRTQY